MKKEIEKKTVKKRVEEPVHGNFRIAAGTIRNLFWRAG